jgi:CO/xanthine dehydrogenase Mo-binding subunit
MDGGGEAEAEAAEEGWGANKSGVVWKALATETVNYVGEALAVVIADDAYSAEDGAELVSVEYDSLPAVTDPEKALDPRSPKVHDYLRNNLSSRASFTAGDVAKAFKRADEVVKVKLFNQRLSPTPMEPRGVVESLINACLDPQARPIAGDKLRLCVQPARLHFFDPTSEMAIR